ncbi:hypothetical protein [Streptomyces sp. NPDC001194]|uniref:hypothetical protein n=1 Tax=Streptomyces sp. NPDC001194 TaxID=3364547 RepID=UPI00368D047E
MDWELAGDEERADPGIVEVLAGRVALKGVVQLAEVNAGPVADEAEQAVEEVALELFEARRDGPPCAPGGDGQGRRGGRSGEGDFRERLADVAEGVSRHPVTESEAADGVACQAAAELSGKGPAAIGELLRVVGPPMEPALARRSGRLTE